MRRAIADELGALLGGPDALGVAVERLGRPQRGALLLVAAVLIEACARWRPACGSRRPCSDARGRRAAGPGAARSRRGAARGLRGRRRRRRPTAASASASVQPATATALVPAGPTATSASCSQQPASLEDGEGLAAEDVRMAGELEQRDGAVEVGRRGRVTGVLAAVCAPGERRPRCRLTRRCEPLERVPAVLFLRAPRARTHSIEPYEGRRECSMATRCDFASTAPQAQVESDPVLFRLPHASTRTLLREARRARPAPPSRHAPPDGQQLCILPWRAAPLLVWIRAVNVIPTLHRAAFTLKRFKISSALRDSPAARAALARVSATANPYNSG